MLASPSSAVPTTSAGAESVDAGITEAGMVSAGSGKIPFGACEDAAVGTVPPRVDSGNWLVSISNEA